MEEGTERAHPEPGGRTVRHPAPPAPAGRLLDSEEAARRLGVKVATLYAYVSRGMLVSHPGPGPGRRRYFEVEEVERLAGRSRQSRTVATRMATVTTGITQLTDGGPVYRGRPAVELAGTDSFEEVAAWLWTGPGPDDVEADGPPGPEAWAPPDLGEPPDVGRFARMRWAVVLAGALDPLRSDLRPAAVRRAARTTAAAMVAALGPAGADGPSGVGRDGPPPPPLAVRMASALSPEPTPELVATVDAALVLLADHELATSTLAVRVAASTRADPYDALLAGLATMAGPLHGDASRLVHGLLVQAEQIGAGPALDDALRWQGVVPGFGHAVYKHGDARFAALFGRFARTAPPARTELVSDLVDLAGRYGIPPPNVDLALGAITWAAGMAPDSGGCLFAVARTAGWAAHYLEELGERPLRYRARAVYATPGRS